MPCAAMRAGTSISPSVRSGRPVRKASHIVGYCSATSASARVTQWYDPGVAFWSSTAHSRWCTQSPLLDSIAMRIALGSSMTVERPAPPAPPCPPPPIFPLPHAPAPNPPMLAEGRLFTRDAVRVIPPDNCSLAEALLERMLPPPAAPPPVALSDTSGPPSASRCSGLAMSPSARHPARRDVTRILTISGLEFPAACMSTVQPRESCALKSSGKCTSSSV
mmetsp:Transcript_16340/g.48681  ORF Transcript_16340/g.48681 Transcript_16340/m.48681 type:complete len:220 (+) Transcript_16340:1724-2383(+)|eukprot:356692-Chlamydomonas_euryale.AAC.5